MHTRQGKRYGKSEVAGSVVKSRALLTMNGSHKHIFTLKVIHHQLLPLLIKFILKSDYQMFFKFIHKAN